MGMLTVGISDLKIALPPDTLVTYALGSCVGICLLDPMTRVAGMSHIMLPTSSVSPGDKNVFKFADTAIPDLVRKMEAKGAQKARLKAKIAGGAQMFGSSTTGKAGATGDLWQIGQRNVAAVTAMLSKLNIPIIAKDVLADYGRTIIFDPATGILTVRAINRNIREL
ncbi:MAG: chemotaxis protein CheD [Oscillospiraceae bacterium]|jgi:chemotaxis protein CheD|nr:chemotaxis protein CheD [Oscillospiraceae bacterium]